MRNIMKAAAFAAMLAIPGAAFAAQATPAAPAAPKQSTASKPATQPAAKPAAAPAAKKSASVAKHTTSGTVKSSSDTSLVITKAGKDQTFVVNSTTEKKGAVETGAKVNVHYTVDGKNWVATAITVAPAKAAKSKSKK
jgi:glucose/arabinose dehydrogenase